MNELASLLRLAVSEHLRNVNTCLPGRVVDYDPATQTATIQPLLKNKLPDGTEETLPPLIKVPVVFPRAGGASITYPLSKGDGVMLNFSQRSLDEWKGNGGEQLVDDPRMLDLSDAIATPGLIDSKNGGGASDCLELKLGDSFVRVFADKVVIGASTVIISADDISITGKLTVEGDIETVDGNLRVDGWIKATGDIDGNV